MAVFGSYEVCQPTAVVFFSPQPYFPLSCFASTILLSPEETELFIGIDPTSNAALPERRKPAMGLSPAN